MADFTMEEVKKFPREKLPWAKRLGRAGLTLLVIVIAAVLGALVYGIVIGLNPAVDTLGVLANLTAAGILGYFGGWKKGRIYKLALLAIVTALLLPFVQALLTLLLAAAGLKKLKLL